MWVDGNAATSERMFIEELIAAYDATDAEKGELMASLESDCAALYQTELEVLTGEEKELLLSNAAVLTHVDDVQLPSEKGILGRFGRMLGLPEEVIARILSEAAEDRAVSLPSRALEEPFGT
jgi:hypothetical protein